MTPGTMPTRGNWLTDIGQGSGSYSAPTSCALKASQPAKEKTIKRQTANGSEIRGLRSAPSPALTSLLFVSSFSFVVLFFVIPRTAEKIETAIRIQIVMTIGRSQAQLRPGMGADANLKGVLHDTAEDER